MARAALAAVAGAAGALLIYILFYLLNRITLTAPISLGFMSGGTLADTLAPKPPTVNLNVASDMDVSSTDNLTNDATPTLSGDDEANSTVELHDGATLLGSTATSDTGAWSLALAQALADGPHSLSATATDAAGNTSPESTPALDVTIDTAKPAARPPYEDFVVSSQLGASTVPVRLTWSGSDPNGIDRYELEKSTNGGAYSSMALPSATATTLTPQLAPGDSHRFRTRARDRAGNVGDWAEAPGFPLLAYQEGSSAMTYPAGAWTRQALASAYGGYLKYATADGARARFTFTGREVAWVAPKGPNRGRAEVWVDGVKIRTIDLYSATGKPRQVVFRGAWATSGNHAVVVVLTGTKNASSSNTRVDVDAFVVIR